MNKFTKLFTKPAGVSMSFQICRAITACYLTKESPVATRIVDTVFAQNSLPPIACFIKN